MNTSPPQMPPENFAESEAEDHATETLRAVREGKRPPEQSMQNESDSSRHEQRREPEPPWQLG